MPKIFGREPAMWLALVAVLVKVASAFWWHASVDQQAVVNAVAAAVVGLVIAIMVRDGISAAILGVVQAVIALALGFGLHLSADRQALLLSLATVVLAMFTRTQVTAPVTAAQMPSRAIRSV